MLLWQSKGREDLPRFWRRAEMEAESGRGETNLVGGGAIPGELWAARDLIVPPQEEIGSCKAKNQINKAVCREAWAQAKTVERRRPGTTRTAARATRPPNGNRSTGCGLTDHV